MLPELADGDFVIVNRLFWSLKPREVIVANHIRYAQIIKRVKSYLPDKGILLEGISDRSVSSEQMGWIPRDQVVGKVIFSVKRT